MAHVSEELLDFLDVINTSSCGGHPPAQTQLQLDVSTSQEEQIVLQMLTDVIDWTTAQDSLSTVNIPVFQL